MPVLVKANEATAARRRVYFHLVSADGVSAATGEAGSQPQVSSNGGAWTNAGIGTLTAVGNGRYYADLTQALVATAGDAVETRFKSAATAECPGDSVRVVAFDPYDATALGLSAVPATLSGNVNVASFSVAGEFGVDGGMRLSGGAISPGLSIGSGGSTGVVIDGGTDSPAVLIRGGTPTGQGVLISTTSGDAVEVTPTAGHALKLAAQGASKHGLFATGGTGGVSDGFSVVAGTGGVPIRGGITGNLSGTVGGVAAGGITADSFAAGAIDEAAVADGAITAGTFAAGAIDSTVVAPNAITSAELATSAVTEIVDAVWANATRSLTAAVSADVTAVNGSAAAAENVATAFATSGSIAADIEGNLNKKVLGSGAGTIVGTGVQASLPTASIASATFAAGATLPRVTLCDTTTTNTDMLTAAAAADKLLGRNVAGGSDGGRTVTKALFALVNRVAISGGVLTVYSTDDLTASWTATVTTDGAADPVVSLDPV